MAEHVDTTPEELQAIAAELRYIADRYSRVSDEMQRRGIAVLAIAGINTLRNEIIPKRVAANAGSAERALTNAAITGGKIASPKQPDLEADAAKAVRKAARRRKEKSG